MTSVLTIEDVRADLAATDRDIKRIGAITDNISDFMLDSAGEDRSRFKLDLMKWQTHLDRAIRLKAAIQAKLEELSE